ncbi:transmembrane protein 216-like [Topomyia yanbarensis]|uniref:transmembrane protein 216-like n=1 Tax=Topomyia yanbarensis TaxID=2498891 RepID=UPI00273C2F77|nr:transmembrane protein 216-like [Topomyia yanbarensis]
MGNPSLTYEILLYLNSFYFGMFAACELGMMSLKAVSLPYPQASLMRDTCVLISLCLIETVRVVLGRRGTLSDHGWQVILSVFLTIPSGLGISYLLLYQFKLFRLEFILCALMLTLQTTELLFALLFVFTLCRPVSYD